MPYRRLVRGLSAVVFATTAVVVVIGWGLGVEVVTSVIPGAVGMKFMTAVGLAAGAAAVWRIADGRRPHRDPLTAALGLVPGVLGVAVLSEYIWHVRLGIDELPFIDHAGHSAHIAFPGRFAPTTGTAFLVLTVALLTVDLGAERRWRISEVLALPVAVIPSMSLIGYAYSIQEFWGPAAAAKMAANTALCFVALAVGLLLCRPRGRILELARTRDPGGVMVRRIIPLCITVPLILGWLQLRSVRSHLFSDPVATWWFAAATIVAMVLIIWWCAGSLSRGDKERRRLEGQLRRLATYDPLSGLLNRGGFEAEAVSLLSRSERYGHEASLLLLDLDRFKPINDQLGHATGDRVLKAVADLLLARLRRSDVAARLGGDEFAVLLLEARDGGAVSVAEDLIRRIGELRVSSDTGVAHTTTSIGIAEILAGGHGLESLLARADAAMYEAKRAGGGQLRQAGPAPEAGAEPAAVPAI